ncbi:CAP domain-containing protein [Streptomyces sp. NPDC058424]|uniref:CAP domain-containing protein n=1 Tax=Streptomyces sp. NPDC058424 TaxID=3346491 RepID=UPI003665B390
MGTHRKKQHYRRIVVAAVVTGAVAIPSTALACTGQPPAPGGNPGWKPQGNPGWNWQKGNPGWNWQKGNPLSPISPPQGAPAESAAPSQPSAPDTAAPAAPSAPDTAAPAAPSAPDASAPAAPSASKDTGTSSGPTARVVELVNAERSKAGCSALTVNAKLTKAAQAHSEDMAAHRNMSHTGSDGSNPGDRITRAGYSWQSYGENVAYGYATPEQVMAGWMSSAGHKANILNCSFKEIGVGLAQPGNYWTQEFGAAR